MEFTVMDASDSELDKFKPTGQYSELKEQLFMLPIGKVLKFNIDPHKNISTLKASFPNWGARWSCKFSYRMDKDMRTMYIWKLEWPAPNGTGA